MENLPQHCLDNAILLRPYDYIDLKMISSGFKTRLKLSQIPDFYTINNKEYFAAEIKTEGFKVSTAALATENVLNIKLQELGGRRHVRNINFLIPTEANAKIASIEVFDDNTIFMRVPLICNF
ncbi:uncharacterized protein LOC122629541 [Vespula pensylvanica]|uniref:Uncharacterized protein n=1 Tax=Vespula pensylvanica TaxID=30213 RepID=A0A834P3F0_VESPE|nr:uncharacterized protein LOC122629541 [Vespula pensylvanica]KAF7427030.1 hypothetical protein H0235_006724 [Vespula pensylvanica]